MLTPDHSPAIHLGQSWILHASAEGGFVARLQESSGICACVRCIVHTWRFLWMLFGDEITVIWDSSDAAANDTVDKRTNERTNVRYAYRRSHGARTYTSSLGCVQQISHRPFVQRDDDGCDVGDRRLRYDSTRHNIGHQTHVRPFFLWCLFFVGVCCSCWCRCCRRRRHPMNDGTATMIVNVHTNTICILLYRWTGYFFHVWRIQNVAHSRSTMIPKRTRAAAAAAARMMMEGERQRRKGRKKRITHICIRRECLCMYFERGDTIN